MRSYGILSYKRSASGGVTSFNVYDWSLRSVYDQDFRFMGSWRLCGERPGLPIGDEEHVTLV